jgi:catechol-2,3-dioxygenase
VENKNKTAIEELYTTDADGNIIELW